MKMPLVFESILAAIITVAVFAPSSVAQTIDDSNIPAQIPLLKDPGPTLASRFGRIPPSGIHPRILIGPQEVLSLRVLLQNTATGKFVLQQSESFLDVIHIPGKELAGAYEHLASGDVNALRYAQSDWWKSKILFAVSSECYDVLIRQDERRGRQAATALATLARIPRNWWTDDTDLVNLAFGYDFDYGYMTEEQRAIVRQRIANEIAGKKPYGSSMPADWRNYNWIPRGMNLLLSALAIEGEKGYDPSIYPLSLEMMRDYLHYGISEEGSGLEEMHYFHYGMEFGSQAMVAFARHGDDLFADAHYRALSRWLIASMEPFGDAFSMHQDTPDDKGGLVANYAIMKWTWPEDPVIDMVWRNRVQLGYRGLIYYEDWIVPRLFPSDPRGWSLNSNASPQTNGGIALKRGNYPARVEGIEALSLPLSYWDPERGLLITRDKWGSDGIVLHFDINVQASGGGGHYHSNSTMFTLSALGRRWAIDRGFHIPETKDNSLILIDGRGQGFFPVGGRTVEYREDADLTLIAGDASEPYHWMTRNRIETGAPYLSGFTWEPDLRPENLKKYGEVAQVDKLHPWLDKASGPSYVYRASYNPVEKAFRTVVLRRGSGHHYLLVIDDIQKDQSTHLYDWLMQVPNDLVIKDKRDRSVVLGSADPSDKRRLLVQMVSVAGEGQWVLEDYDIKRSPETGDTSSFGKGKRLKYSVRSIDPAFKVLLYPYLDGTMAPTVSLTTSLDLSWPDKKDSYELTTLPSGRTSLHLIGKR